MDQKIDRIDQGLGKIKKLAHTFHSHVTTNDITPGKQNLWKSPKQMTGRFKSIPIGDAPADKYIHPNIISETPSKWEYTMANYDHPIQATKGAVPRNLPGFEHLARNNRPFRWWRINQSASLMNPKEDDPNESRHDNYPENYPKIQYQTMDERYQDTYNPLNISADEIAHREHMRDQTIQAGIMKQTNKDRDPDNFIFKDPEMETKPVRPNDGIYDTFWSDPPRPTIRPAPPDDTIHDTFMPEPYSYKDRNNEETKRANVNPEKASGTQTHGRFYVQPVGTTIPNPMNASTAFVPFDQILDKSVLNENLGQQQDHSEFAIRDIPLKLPTTVPTPKDFGLPLQ